MKTLLRHCMVWDGSGGAPFPGDVLVDGQRIGRIGRQPGRTPWYRRARHGIRELLLVLGAIERESA